MNTIQVVQIISFVSIITPAIYLLVEILCNVVTISSNTNNMNTIHVVNIIFSSSIVTPTMQLLDVIIFKTVTIR